MCTFSTENAKIKKRKRFPHVSTGKRVPLLLGGAHKRCGFVPGNTKPITRELFFRLLFSRYFYNKYHFYRDASSKRVIQDANLSRTGLDLSIVPGYLWVHPKVPCSHLESPKAQRFSFALTQGFWDPSTPHFSQLVHNREIF